MKKQSKESRILGALVLASIFGVAGMANAQPGGNGGNNRPDFRNMTPEQRQQAMAQFQERRLREQLTQAGFAEATIQDPIVTFSKSLDAIRTPLRDKTTKLREAVANKSGDADVTTLIKDLRTSTEVAKKQRDEALKELEGKIGYTQKPRLEAFLITEGLLGDEVSFASDGGGRGAFGGQGRGGRGGRGNNANNN